MRCNLIEAAWVAIRQDPAMNLFYTEQCKRMPKSKAIVKVARKLVNRLYFVLKHRPNMSIVSCHKQPLPVNGFSQREYYILRAALESA